MQEPYEEGVATHFGPESCAVVRKVVGEALTGVSLGWPLSREIGDSDRGADALTGSGRPHPLRRHRKTRRDLARPETPRTGGNIPHGNREVPRLPGKPPNKAGQPVAEAVEGRGLAKGNSPECNTLRTQSREGVSSAPGRVRQAGAPERHDPRQEPDAVMPHVRICGGGRG